MKPTPIPENYTELEEFAVKALRDEIRTSSPDPERVTALATALKATVECMGNSFNFRHFVNNQQVMLAQQQAQMAAAANQQPPHSRQ